MELNGHEYRIGKLDTFKQFHVARRVAPLLASFFEGIAGGDAPQEANDADALASAFGPIAGALAQMSDEDADYVIKTCLRVVKRVDGDHAFDLMTASGTLRYADLPMADMVQLVIAVGKENALLDFFSTGQSPLSPAKP